AASSHFAVRKEERGGRTQVGIWHLDRDERVAEVARMLGGDSPSALTVAHAQEMLEKLDGGRI
ncbi:MAG TPA: DNA repair protein RecN, partial [Bacillota bacterium]|nr:DNA repair protein RecN [Bacillota bacterium]